MIVQGDARFLPLASGSVQCIVTSPPYWGLRDYKLEPLMWGGKAGCVHWWGVESRSHQRQRNGAKGGIHTGRPIDKLASNVTLHPSQGVLCQSCGAWRGSLGLEPTPNFVRRVLSETWEPGCACAAPSESQRVLDPFGGSGTVAVVARQLGRRAVVLDLNAAYCQLAREREEKEG